MTQPRKNDQDGLGWGWHDFVGVGLRCWYASVLWVCRGAHLLFDKKTLDFSLIHESMVLVLPLISPHDILNPRRKPQWPNSV